MLAEASHAFERLKICLVTVASQLDAVCETRPKILRRELFGSRFTPLGAQRPSFKQSNETLLLQMADSGAVDRPALAPIGFGISSLRQKGAE